MAISLMRRESREKRRKENTLFKGEEPKSATQESKQSSNSTTKVDKKQKGERKREKSGQWDER